MNNTRQRNPYKCQPKTTSNEQCFNTQTGNCFSAPQPQDKGAGERRAAQVSSPLMSNGPPQYG